MVKPSVEILILHHNGIKLIDSCLKTLIKTKYNNFKITLLDQNSSDGSASFIRKKYPQVNLIESKKNLGFAEASNILLRKSKAKYVVLLNNDTEQDPNWLSELVRLAESDKKIFAVQPKIKSLLDKVKFEYAGAAGGFIDIYGYPLCRGRIFDKIEYDKGQYEEIFRIFWGSGAALLIRRSILDKIGYLDEDFFAYAEELDLCWRANLAGYKIFYNPKSVVYHLGSGSWGNKSLSFKKEYLVHRNHSFILIKNYSLITLLKIMPFKIFLEMIAFLGFFILEPKRSLAIILANLSLIINIPSLIRKNKLINKIKIIPDNELKKLMIRKSIAFWRYVLGRKLDFKDYFEIN